MDRRDFLVRSGLVLGAAAMARVEAASLPDPDPTVPGDWKSVKGEFLLDRGLIHMSGFYLASHPRPVREAIERHRKALDENPFEEHHLHYAEHEARTLKAAAAYLGVNPLDIALTDSTTMGLGLTYTGLKVREGQEIVQTTHDHQATNMSLKFRADRTGTSVRRVSLYKSGASATQEGMVEAIRAAITDRTRVVAITWVHSSTGVRTPVRAIADAIGDFNKNRGVEDRILLCVDGVHGIGVEDVSLPDLGCDFFIAGCHKWLLGPRGTGFVWGREKAWEQATQTIPPFPPDRFDPRFSTELLPGDPSRRALTGTYMTPGGFHSFEHRWALAEAFQFHQRIGKSQVAERIHALTRPMREELSKMKHVTLHTPMSDEVCAGIVCFEVAGLTPHEAVAKLREKKILASVTPYEVKYARLSAGLINDEADVETSLRAVRDLA